MKRTPPNIQTGVVEIPGYECSYGDLGRYRPGKLVYILKAVCTLADVIVNSTVCVQ